MKFLIVLESLALVAWGLYVWRRTRAADAPYGRPILILFLALTLQTLALGGSAAVLAR